MTMHTKAAIASVVSGKMLCERFSEVHACIETFAGGAVFMHMIPDLMKDLRPILLGIYPEYSADKFAHINRDTIGEWVASNPGMAELVEVSCVMPADEATP